MGCCVKIGMAKIRFLLLLLGLTTLVCLPGCVVDDDLDDGPDIDVDIKRDDDDPDIIVTPPTTTTTTTSAGQTGG